VDPARPRHPQARLEENIGAADIELTAHDLADFEAAAWIDVQGARYPEAPQRLFDR
jgi:diketogulonate reductase-like aldo/keto reductase